MHPQLAEGYRRRIERLERLLEGSEQDEAREIVRSMIERVELTPRRPVEIGGPFWPIAGAQAESR
jgi:hypothetical protein